MTLALELPVHVFSGQAFFRKVKEVAWVRLMCAPPMKNLQIKEGMDWAQKHA